jgi:nucleoside-diphosphate-sugar epimerase
MMLILGAGYVGRALRAAAPGAVATHRPGAPLGPGERAFALEDEGTWPGLPVHGADVVWTFPAAPLPLVRKFHAAALGDAHTLVVFGSTSAYAPAEPDALITERSPLDLAQPRVAGEEWLREQGAAVLQLAGIWGPGREPLGWLTRGLIRNGRKRVNLIHVADIVATVLAVQAAGLRGERINVSDGAAESWNDIVAALAARGALPAGFALPQQPPDASSKRVANDRLRALLPGRALRTFPDSHPG